MPLLPILAKLAPTILTWGFKKINAKKTSAGIEANPRATNGGVTTALVTLVVALLGSYGVTSTGLEPVIASVFGTIGTIYTFWRMER